VSKMFEDMKRGLEEVDAFLAGETARYRVTLPPEVDVKSIRKGLKMTQSRFSETFGCSLDAVKHWEGGRRTPESSARAFLTVIARNPGAVIAALHPELEQSAGHSAAAQKTGIASKFSQSTSLNPTLAAKSRQGWGTRGCGDL